MAETSEKSFPFDSVEVNGKPDRVYVADDFAEYFRAFISSGMFMKQSDNLQVIENGDMSVTLRPGRLIIDGYGYVNPFDIIIQLEPADGTRSRYDRISLTWINEERRIRYTVQKGELSYEPVPPACRRTADYKDYVTADILVSAGAIKITDNDITDQRLNSKVCGLAFPFYDIDTTMVFNQLQAFYNKVVRENGDWKAALEEWCIALKQEKTQQLQQIITNLTEMKEGAETEFNDWFTSNTNNWANDWYAFFDNMKEQLSEEPATHLQSQIGNLKELKTSDKSNLTAAVNEVNAKIDDDVAIQRKALKAYAGSLGTTYPTQYGIWRGVGNNCAGLPSGASKYGVLLIYATGYVAHIYYDVVNQRMYFGKTDDSIKAPSSWIQILGSANGILPIANGGTGNSTGNAPSATKATQDAAGNVITSTYARKDSVLNLVEKGQFTNETIVLPLKFDATYLLVTREITISNGKVYGYRARLYATPTRANSSVAASAANLAASSNAGVTLGTNAVDANRVGYGKNDYAITLKATAAYQVSYALYEFSNTYGDYLEEWSGGPFQPPTA